MKQIQRLDPLLINQISAGEVIRQPASVLKELLENSIDAGSTSIYIKLDQGGKNLIEVQDNGEGIAKHDLPLAIATHTTSKIVDLEDLHTVASFGFRGEALASIASVSKFTLMSRKTDELEAAAIRVKGKNTDQVLSITAHPIGTTVRVEDLFFNIPVRKKFLKQSKTEYLSCEMIVKRIALAHPSVSIELNTDNKMRLFYPAKQGHDNLKRRIAKVLGKRFMDHAQSLEITEQGITLQSYLAMPVYHRSQSDQQFVFLNRRFIKDKLILHAIRQAYTNYLPIGRLPAFVLFLEMDPVQFNVNVHPEKYEVQFHDARFIHDFIAIMIRNHLSSTLSKISPQETIDILPTMQMKDSDHLNISNSEKRMKPLTHSRVAISLQKGIKHKTCARHNHNLKNEAHKPVVVIRAKKMIIIDPMRFYVTYFYKQMQDRASWVPENLMFPVRADLSIALSEPLSKIRACLEQLGFFVDRLSEQVVLLRTIPKQTITIDECAFFPALLASLKNKIPTRNQLIRFYLNFILLDDAMRSENVLCDFLDQDPSLPKIVIDLEKFEVEM